MLKQVFTEKSCFSHVFFFLRFLPYYPKRIISRIMAIVDLCSLEELALFISCHHGSTMYSLHVNQGT